MSVPTEEEVNGFVNALQLCIKTKIAGAAKKDDDSVVIRFADVPHADDKLLTFIQLFEGEWEKKHKTYRITESRNIDWQKLTFFLLITRLNTENIIKLSEMDPTAEKLVSQLGIEQDAIYIRDVKHASEIVFRTLKDKGMTMRELAEKTGLSQVSLSKFKAGNDIRFSNLIKIARALNLKLMLK